MRLAALALLLAAAPAGHAEEAPLLGFTRERSQAQRKLERDFLLLPDAARCESLHRELTRTPHVAGTPAAERIAGYVADRLRDYGLEVETASYDVLLSSPRSVEVELLAPDRERLGNPEDAIAEDPQSGDASLSGPWNAYSASGTVEGEVVYVNFGRVEDYDALAHLGVDVRGKIALARAFKGYRGGQSLEAEHRGVAALVLYSDPEEDGYVQGDTYPTGPWGPESHVQRGAAVYDFVAPGDPLTPGWASLPGARRLAEAEAAALPKLMSVPLSFRDARRVLQALAGPVRPSRAWQGGGAFAYHVGPGPARLRVALDVPRETRTIRDVIGRLPGADPDPEIARQTVLVSNHYDAWTFGSVEASSGTTAALELARALGELAKRGARPRRTILFGIWDAAEFALAGSTEWGEQHADTLTRDAVACLNVDAAASGDSLSISAVPSLRPFIHEAARAVPDPRGRGSLYDAWRLHSDAGENDEPPVFVPGGRSDHTVFLNHLGVPSVDMTFEGPSGVSASAYDSHAWMERFGDPGFRHNAAMVQLWGVMTLRLANADVPPFDYHRYAREILTYLDDLQEETQKGKLALALGAARGFAERLATMEPRELAADAGVNRVRSVEMLKAERCLLAADGIPDRPWYKHLIYAPLPSYEVETLPGLREAIVARDLPRARAQVDTLAGGLACILRILKGDPQGDAR